MINLQRLINDLEDFMWFLFQQLDLRLILVQSIGITASERWYDEIRPVMLNEARLILDDLNGKIDILEDYYEEQELVDSVDSISYDVNYETTFGEVDLKFDDDVLWMTDNDFAM